MNQQSGNECIQAPPTCIIRGNESRIIVTMGIGRRHKANGMYLEMEMDNLRSLKRQIEYWDVYEEMGVLESWPITYYESGSMFPSRENIADPD